MTKLKMHIEDLLLFGISAFLCVYTVKSGKVGDVVFLQDGFSSLVFELTTSVTEAEFLLSAPRAVKAESIG